MLNNIISDADGFLVCTGSGMSADSDIPVYVREDIWGPTQEELDLKYPGLCVEDIHDFGNKNIFESKSEILWKYFFDLAILIQNSNLHSGYFYLKKIIQNKPHYVLTSNIDNLHLRSGIHPLNLVQCHGSFLDVKGNIYVQCIDACHSDIWTHSTQDIHQIPRCSYCRKIARPNFLSFNDESYVVPFNSISRKEMISWINQMKDKKLIIFEIGIGDHVKTVRNRSRKTWKDCSQSVIIRINPNKDPHPETERYYQILDTALIGLNKLVSL